jgi:hypothetical protein
LTGYRASLFKIQPSKFKIGYRASKSEIRNKKSKQFARRNNGASWKTRAPREVQGGAL